MYRARNIYGWSNYSPIDTVMMYGYPTQPLSPTISQDPASTQVEISWSVPSSTGGTGISVTYSVYIIGQDSEFHIIECGVGVTEVSNTL
jgi:hypothetical protein